MDINGGWEYDSMGILTNVSHILCIIILIAVEHVVYKAGRMDGIRILLLSFPLELFSGFS